MVGYCKKWPFFQMFTLNDVKICSNEVDFSSKFNSIFFSWRTKACHLQVPLLPISWWRPTALTPRSQPSVQTSNSPARDPKKEKVKLYGNFLSLRLKIVPFPLEACGWVSPISFNCTALITKLCDIWIDSAKSDTVTSKPKWELIPD
jgi:hypothetical protein